MTDKIKIQRNTETYFDEVVTFLCSLVSLTLTAEFYVTGKAQPYSPVHDVVLDAKQPEKRLRFFPHNILSNIFSLQWPQFLELDEEPISIPSSAALDLGALEIPLTSLANSMFVGYFERTRPEIELRFGADPYGWPLVWNFGRIVRNAIVHRGEIEFKNSKAGPVSWEGLTYGPSDKGRRIINTDIWPGDLLYLLMEMDSHTK